MGAELRGWLADRLPAEVSSGERLVALEIADWAHDETRLAYGRDLMPTVVRRTGLADDKQVGKALGKLSVRGIELRQPIKDVTGKPLTDKLGRTIFACRGHETTYRIPELHECPALVPFPGDQIGPPLGGPNSGKAPRQGVQTREMVSLQGDQTPVMVSPAEGQSAEWSPHRGSMVPPQGGPTTDNHSQLEITLSTSPTRADDDPAFAEFWELYPKKSDKAGARREWKRAIKAGATPDAITAGAKTYAAHWAGANHDELHWAVKSTNWLRDAMWTGTWPIRKSTQPNRPGGNHEPYRTPDDPSIYDSEF